jgi:hypothetical protein
VTPRLRLPTTALLKIPLALAYSKTAQPLDVSCRVIAVPAGGAPGDGQGTEPFAEPQPARGYAELFGCLCDRERLPRLQHAGSIDVVS